MSQVKDSISRSEALGLAAMGLAVLVIANDFTALSIALPAIEEALSSDVTTTQWVINGYALVFGILIVTGGRLADMYGRRRIFFIGSAIFAVFSVLAGLADDVWLLLVSRGIMGIGGAMMWPAILGMTYAIVPRSRAGIAGGGVKRVDHTRRVVRKVNIQMPGGPIILAVCHCRLCRRHSGKAENDKDAGDQATWTAKKQAHGILLWYNLSAERSAR